MPAPKKTKKSALEIIDRDIGDDEELRQLIKEEHVNVRVARLIYDSRKAVGLSQQELADLVGTKQSAISRLEDADYDGHSLSMLARIASALGSRLVVDFEEVEQAT